MADTETDSTAPAPKTVPYFADDFDTISSQATEEHSSFHKALSDCFHALRESREEAKPLFANDPTEEPKSSAETESGILNRVPAAVAVNFIDPTTKLSPGPKSNTLAKSSSGAGIENVYEKLTYVFERDYGSTLRSIQYKNPRTGDNSVISSLPVTSSLFGTVSDNAISAPLSEPSEWHTGPFCHVYIAACQGLEHYRAKIRPSLQAFVSQIESAATQPQLATTGGQGGHSAHFLVVYIPTGAKEKNEDNKPENVRSAVANRLSMVRRRFANKDELDGSQHSRDSLDSNGVLDEKEEEEVGSLSLLSKTERNIYKKIAADFPNGKVCALSRASLSSKIETEEVSSSGFGIKTQEWNSFNRCLGQVIVSGFKDRCRRYKDELRRLDTQRASEASARKNGSHVPPEFNEFNLANFFLVKESLAFTYEQMQLFSEALLQYDEFRGFLPQLTTRGYMEAKRDREHCEALKPDPDSPTLLELADSGDFTGFRKKIQQVSDLKPILDTMNRYLFARELCLLTKMEQPAELVARCRRFIKMMYGIMMRGISECSPEEQKLRKIKAAEWVIQCSWDVKCASEQYLLSMAEAMRSSFRDDASQGTSLSLTSDSSDATRLEQVLARQLSELLEVARLLYKELGSLKFLDGNPLKAYESVLPADMFELWKPWEAQALKPKDETLVVEKKNKEPPRRVSIIQRASVPMINDPHDKREFILKTAFDSKESYEDIYLEMASSLVTLNKFAGRKRFAARHQGDIAESFVRSGLLVEAAKIFKKTVRICRWDHWDRCHFYRLFRLAYCQRTTAKPSDYLKTLVSAFSPRTTAVAPPLALLYLQDDLEAVIGHPSVGEARYGKLAFLEAQMKIENTSDDPKSLGAAFDRKQLAKKYCSVGETVRIQVTLNSNLPRAIELNSLQLFIVPFDSFSSIVENHESVEEEDAFKILTIGAPIKLATGANTYFFEWSPSTAGQYILSTAEIVWKQGYFYYDGMDLPENLYGVDVLPSEPTHSLSIEPAVLLPGHDQEVHLTFNAADDFIVAGKLQLDCSEGLTIIPPGEDPSSGNWQSSCEVDLGSYKAGETKLFIAHVRCGLIDKFSRQSILQQSSIDKVHGFSVKGVTTYLHEESVDADHPMRNTMELFAPILEKTALSVEGIDLVWVAERQRAIVSIQLISNTPRYFSLENWKLVLPPPFSVTNGVDLNGDLLKCKVFNGDELSLAFDCSVVDGADGSGDEEPILQVELSDDVGKKFSLDLPIDMNEHYLQVLESSATPKSRGTAAATVALGAPEGQVGEPVIMSFKIDQESLGSAGTIAYSISSDGSNWLIGGQVNGIIDTASLSCNVIAIPTVAGQLSSFPSIRLRSSLGNGEYSPLITKMQYPPTFQSLARTSEVAVAFSNSK
ncbi:unnamed protein product [Cylindrotheca closterium]|uniref:TRAPPC10/Trs130 N-terminal domain-containing protein n=1 Tax=Cylindrotheca closterium TaxID=2856 RepID=A0AAD2CSU7_9STRA|nr:unnamed protein product [Cylindrotheca closterium]